MAGGIAHNEGLNRAERRHAILGRRNEFHSSERTLEPTLQHTTIQVP